jgi:hypothetical protein
MARESELNTPARGLVPDGTAGKKRRICRLFARLFWHLAER